jgi:hypothetical protein
MVTMITPVTFLAQEIQVETLREKGSLFEFRILCISSVTDVVVEFQNLEPGLEIFPPLGEILKIIGKNGERFGIAVGCVSFHGRGKSLYFPMLPRRLAWIPDTGSPF